MATLADLKTFHQQMDTALDYADATAKALERRARRLREYRGELNCLRTGVTSVAVGGNLLGDAARMRAKLSGLRDDAASDEALTTEDYAAIEAALDAVEAQLATLVATTEGK